MSLCNKGIARNNDHASKNETARPYYRTWLRNECLGAYQSKWWIDMFQNIRDVISLINPHRSYCKTQLEIVLKLINAYKFKYKMQDLKGYIPKLCNNQF